MHRNRLREIWEGGKPVLNGWLSIANPFTAEIMAAQGYDSITVDIQHGAIDYQSGLAMFQAMLASGVAPIARVPWLDPAAVMKVLDAGAYGVICPMVNTREDAERLASYMRYPPHGVRSFGPTRATFSTGGSYWPAANDEVLCFAMIETAEAMKNLDAIVSTPGIDAVYIGPADLTLGLFEGKYPPGFDREEPEMVEAIQQVLAAAHGAGIKAALHCGTPAYAAKAVGWGFDMVTVGSDARMLATAANRTVTETRALFDGSDAPAPAAPTGVY